MSIGYDDETCGFTFISPNCGDCGQPRYDTGCDAPGCDGHQCDACGSGCDRDNPGGSCARALAAESEDEYTARVNRGRAAFGLSPVTAED